MADSITSSTLDQLFSGMPTGSLDRAILNNLRGINHRQIAGMVPMNKDMPGLTFFVRPQLNMQRDNLRNVRKLSALLSQNSTSMQAYIRSMLDPRLQTGVSYETGTIPPERIPIVDNLTAFIPPFTNNLNSISGWPSISVPTFSAKAGLYNEGYSMVDGRVINDEVFDLNVNFRNTRGDPILYLLYVWGLYQSLVFEGKLVPYLDFITENEIDYNTRVYRLVLDYRKQYVTKIAATRAAFPVGIPVGDAFDIPGDAPYSEANRDIGISFRCMGVDYFDDILVKEFNETVAIFNPSMSDQNRNNQMTKIPYGLLQSMNGVGYPHIDMTTTELEWWVPKSGGASSATGLTGAMSKITSAATKAASDAAGKALSAIQTSTYDGQGD